MNLDDQLPPDQRIESVPQEWVDIVFTSLFQSGSKDQYRNIYSISHLLLAKSLFISS